ncbi:hypothetical protein MTO96_020964 [Rhipicephalus appendiculatus]
MLPGQRQRRSQSAVTATPSGHAWPSQSPQGLGAEQPAIATVEASELLQVGSNTTTAPPTQPPRYAPNTRRRSHMTTSLTEVSPVGETYMVAASSSLAPVGSLGSVPASAFDVSRVLCADCARMGGTRPARFNAEAPKHAGVCDGCAWFRQFGGKYRQRDDSEPAALLRYVHDRGAGISGHQQRGSDRMPQSKK